MSQNPLESHSTTANLPASPSVWILDKDSILTDPNTGLPLCLALSSSNKEKLAELDDNELITLNLETLSHLSQPATAENQTETTHTQVGKVDLPTHAIRRQTAYFLGLIDSNNDTKNDSTSDRTSSHNFVSLRALLNQLPMAIINYISKAIQLIRWADDHNFCSRCGHRTTLHTKGEPATVCPTCHYHQYPRIQPCVITAITRVHPVSHKPQVLLAHHKRYAKAEKQDNSPARYGLIAGFVEVGETLENAVHRETMEEVNIAVTNIRYLTSQPWAYPSNLMVGFIADYATGDADNIKVQEDELTHAKFFDLDELPLIPPVGTIAYRLLEYLTHAHGLPSPTSAWSLQ